MPLYEYTCASCGSFTGWQAMRLAGAPSPCPTCGQPGERILSATRGGGARAHPKAEREPTLVARTTDPERSARKPAVPAPVGNGRPWMIGH